MVKRGVSHQAQSDFSLQGLAVFSSLIKVPISLMTAFSAFTGYVLADSTISLAPLWTTLSIFLLSSGASALNNVQDITFDMAFSRTRKRPLPGRRISRSKVMGLSMMLLGFGLAGLFAIRMSFFLPLLGLGAVVLYNGVYTPLKKTTLLAILPGAVCGAIPPLIGYAVAGGHAFSFRILILMAIVGVWQVPHFWLLVLANKSDYIQSNIPSMLNVLPERRLKRLVFIWMFAFACMVLLLPMFGMVTGFWTSWLLMLYISALVCFFGWALFSKTKRANHELLFTQLNLAMGAVLTLVTADRLMG